MSLSTHILDTARGLPAQGVAVVAERLEGAAFVRVGAGVTDGDGRARDLVAGEEGLTPGEYRLTFATGPYFEALGVPSFYPQVTISFTVRDDRHHHVPLLLAPWGYSTYRGT
jgi:5-hydroxyisourate hydrolase